MVLNAASVHLPLVLSLLTISYWIRSHVWSSDLSPAQWYDMSALHSTPLLWSWMFVTKGLKKQILQMKTAHCLLFRIEGRCPVWVCVKQNRKIITSTQREMHVFAQCLKAQRRGRVTGWICQNLSPSYFIFCLWNLGKTITGNCWGRGRVWTPKCTTICLKEEIRDKK